MDDLLSHFILSLKYTSFNEFLCSKGHKSKVELGMDVAASEFWDNEKKIYDLDFKTPKNDGSN